MSHRKSVVVVGGGIGGLVSAQVLKALSSTQRGFDVMVLEESSRPGGQVRTEKLVADNGRGNVIIEAGAEGFVARSAVYPKVAEMAGLDSSQLVSQQRIADNELSWNQDNNAWDIQELDPGVAAMKLGFQVPKEERGRGIRSFRLGMGQLVDKISANIAVKTGAKVTSVEKTGGGFSIGYDLVGIQNKLIADAVVVATPNRVIKSLLGSRYDLPDLPHHSHVSVHLLVPENATAIPPRSFTIPVDIQSRFKGLRACSLINEKFPGRAPTNESLFRFYFRPESVESVNDRAFWVDSAVGALDEIFGLRSPITWTHFAPWVSALPTFSEEYLGKCDELKRILRKDYDSKLVLVGAEVTGAGLEAAARSGFDAAVSLVNVLYE